MVSYLVLFRLPNGHCLSQPFREPAIGQKANLFAGLKMISNPPKRHLRGVIFCHIFDQNICGDPCREWGDERSRTCSRIICCSRAAHASSHISWKAGQPLPAGEGDDAPGVSHRGLVRRRTQSNARRMGCRVDPIRKLSSSVSILTIERCGRVIERR